MVVVVVMPNTAVNVNERRKRKVKNGMRRSTKSRRRRKSEGRRMNQPKRKTVTNLKSP